MTAVESDKLWGGRFSSATDPVLEEFNFSITYDKKMYAEDIRGSIAYASAIQKAGIITSKEADELIAGLEKVLAEWESGAFEIAATDEDIHTANERRLTELVGAVAGKLHTGRSRNDQVATDMRMWLTARIPKLDAMLSALLTVIADRAETEADVIMPGYTHMQRAQSIRWSHYLLSYAFAFKRDLTRLRLVRQEANRSPLGSGALAGNPFDIDRESLTEALGFAETIENSLDATRDRDFVVQLLQWSALAGTHLSSMAEDLILYSTKEFGYVKLADAYSTGSSLMPQKKNADSLELIRGKAGRLQGLASGFLTTLKGLPTTYNKDLQDDKIAMFESVETMEKMIQIMTGVVATLTIDATEMRKALTDDMLATDVAYFLVRKGVPFREAHVAAGKAVKLAEDRECPLKDLDVPSLKLINASFDAGIANIFDFDTSTEQYSVTGGTSKASCVAQVAKLRNFLNGAGASDDVATPTVAVAAPIAVPVATATRVEALHLGGAGLASNSADRASGKGATTGNKKNTSSLGSGFYDPTPQYERSSTKRVAPPGGQSSIVF